MRVFGEKLRVFGQGLTPKERQLMKGIFELAATASADEVEGYAILPVGSSVPGGKVNLGNFDFGDYLGFGVSSPSDSPVES